LNNRISTKDNIVHKIILLDIPWCILMIAGKRRILIIFSLNVFSLIIFGISFLSGLGFLVSFQRMYVCMLFNLTGLICLGGMFVFVVKWFGWHVIRSFRKREICKFSTTKKCLLCIWLIGLRFNLGGGWRVKHQHRFLIRVFGGIIMPTLVIPCLDFVCWFFVFVTLFHLTRFYVNV